MTDGQDYSTSMKRIIEEATADHDPVEQATTFLGAMFGEIEGGHVVLSGIGPDGNWHDSIADAELGQPNSIVRLAETAARLAHDDKYDVYVAMHTMNGPKRHGKNALRTPALWTEFDLAGSSDKKGYEPWANLAEIEKFIHERIGLEPSMVIDSGNGYHFYWLFDEALWWWDEETYTESESVLTRWEGWLHSEAKAVGRGLDTVVDMARVLRVPGTFNMKRGEAKPVEIISQKLTNRYAPSDIQDRIPAEHAGRSLSQGLGHTDGHSSGRFLTDSDIMDYLNTFGTETTPVGQDAIDAAMEQLRDTVGGRHFALVRGLATLVQSKYRAQIAMSDVLNDWRGTFDSIKDPKEQTPDEFNQALRNVARRRIAEDEQKQKDLDEFSAKQKVISKSIGDLIPVDMNLKPVTQVTSRATTLPQQIVWPEFWQREIPDDPWLIEPLIARGRQTALYAGAKTGKSLITLEAALLLATGDVGLLRDHPEPKQHVIYIDQEQTEDDLDERITDMGFRDHDLSHLHYYLLQAMPPLNSREGGDVLLALVEQDNPVAVIIDTVIRTTVGDENSAETFNAFATYTGTPLKQRGVAVLRLDHTGKEESRGQRGTSAKDGDVDIVMLLRSAKDRIEIIAEKARVGWVRQFTTFTRGENPLRHERSATLVSVEVLDAAKMFEDNDVPIHMGRGAVRKYLTDECGMESLPNNAVLSEAIKYRKKAGGGKPFHLPDNAKKLSGDRSSESEPKSAGQVDRTVSKNQAITGRDRSPDRSGQVADVDQDSSATVRAGQSNEKPETVEKSEVEKSLEEASKDALAEEDVAKDLAGMQDLINPGGDGS